MKRNAHRRLILISFGGAAICLANPIFAQSGQEMAHPIPSGASAAAAAAKDEEERKDPEYGSAKKSKERFTYGKRKEEAVESKGSATSIQKTKDGSADATVSTGVFKDSLLDVDLPREHPASKPTPTPAEPVNPLRRTKIEAAPAASPGANPAAATRPAPLTSSPLDITTGISIPTPTPKPQSP